MGTIIRRLTHIFDDEVGSEQAIQYGWAGSGSEGDDLYFRALIDGDTYYFVVESNLCGGNSDVYTLV